jgi:hypothetical protein
MISPYQIISDLISDDIVLPLRTEGRENGGCFLFRIYIVSANHLSAAHGVVPDPTRTRSIHTSLPTPNDRVVKKYISCIFPVCSEKTHLRDYLYPLSSKSIVGERNGRWSFYKLLAVETERSQQCTVR